MIKNNEKSDFNNHSIRNISQNYFFDPTDDNHAANKSSVDSLSGNSRIGRDMSAVFLDQNNPFDEKI